MRLFRHELDRFQDGLLFYYFSSVDQNSHMLWGKYDDELLEIYKARGHGHRRGYAEGGQRYHADGHLSDHGFARFDRAVHLNTFLMKEGFLALDDPANVGDEELVRARGLGQDRGLRDRAERPVSEPGRPRGRRHRAGGRQAD